MSKRNGNQTRRNFLKMAGSVAGVAALQACAPMVQAPEAPTSVSSPPTQVPATTTTPAPIGAPTTIKRGGVLTHAVHGDITFMDPQKCSDIGSLNFTEQVYEGLLQYDKDLNVVPGVADWEMPDDRTYLFRIREGVKFHDGSVLDAEDVKYTVDYIINPDNGVVGAAYFNSIDTVEVIDKHTVSMKLKYPDPTLPGAFAYHRGEALVKAGAHDNDNEIVRKPNGTGPFKLVEYLSASHYEFERHGDYWNKDLPLLDGMLFKIMPEEDPKIAALVTGQIDHAELSPEGYLRVAEEPTLNVLSGPIASVVTAEWNPTRTFPDGTPRPWADKRVRRALEFATDRREIIEKAQNGFGELSGCIYTGYGDWYTPPEELRYEYDLDKAKQLLKEAGWADGFEVNMLASPDLWDGTLTASAIVLAAQWAKVGVQANIEQVEWAVSSKRVGPHDPPFDYDLSFTGHSYRPDVKGYFDTVFDANPEHGTWNPGYDNPRVNELLTQARIEGDREKRKAMYREAEEIILYDECWWLYLFLRSGFHGMQKYVEGFNWDIRNVFDTAKYMWLNK